MEGCSLTKLPVSQAEGDLGWALDPAPSVFSGPLSSRTHTHTAVIPYPNKKNTKLGRDTRVFGVKSVEKRLIAVELKLAHFDFFGG